MKKSLFAVAVAGQICGFSCVEAGFLSRFAQNGAYPNPKNDLTPVSYSQICQNAIGGILRIGKYAVCNKLFKFGVQYLPMYRKLNGVLYAIIDFTNPQWCGIKCGMYALCNAMDTNLLSTDKWYLRAAMKLPMYAINYKVSGMLDCMDFAFYAANQIMGEEYVAYWLYGHGNNVWCNRAGYGKPLFNLCVSRRVFFANGVINFVSKRHMRK